MSETNNEAYYRFFCDYFGKVQFLNYLESKENSEISKHTHNWQTGSSIINFGSLNKAQRVLWAYYFFKLIGLNPRDNVDVSVLIKFLHVTNNLELTNYKNSYFYKLAWKAPKTKVNPQKLIHDLNLVKQHFKELGLSIAEIEHEISMLS